MLLLTLGRQKPQLLQDLRISLSATTLAFQRHAGGTRASTKLTGDVTPTRTGWTTAVQLLPGRGSAKVLVARVKQCERPGMCEAGVEVPGLGSASLLRMGAVLGACDLSASVASLLMKSRPWRSV